MINKIYKLTLFIFCLTTVFGFQINHQKIDSVINNQAIRFDMQLMDANIASVDKVEVFYKGDMDDNYSATILSYIPVNQYYANITPILNDSSQFLYYFKVTMIDGVSYTLPQFFAADSPFVSDIKKSEFDPRIKLLTPLNKAFIDDGLPVIMISYEDPYDILDLSTIVLKLGDKDVTKEANIYKKFINFVPQTSLSEEQHDLFFSVKDKNKQEYTIKSSFTYRPRKPKLVDIKGTNQTIVDLYNSDKDISVRSRPDAKYSNSLEMNLQSGFLLMDIYDYKTSEESSLSQKLNRTKLSIYDDKGYFKATFLDSSPILSQYTLNGINVDGVNINVALPNVVNFTYVKSTTKKTLAGNPSVNCSFLQQVDAYQLGLKVGGWDTSFIYTHFLDDVNSIPSTVNWGNAKPEENMVAAWYNKVNFNEEATTFLKSEVAGSIYYSDATGTGNKESLPTEAKKIIPEAILNMVPIRTSIQGGGAGYLEFNTPFLFRELGVKTYTSMASKGFKSFGNSSIKTDDLTYGAEAKLNLFRSMLSLSGGYQKNQNNIFKLFDTSLADPYTTFGDDYKAMVNMDVFGLVNFGYNFNLNLKKNDSTQDVSLVDNQTRSDLFSFTNIKLEMDKFVGRLNTNYQLVQYIDAVSSGNSFDQRAIGVIVDTEWYPVKLKFGVSKSDQDNKGNTPNTTLYMAYSTRIDYEYIPKILNTYAGLSFQTGANNGNDINKRIDNSKTTITLGGIYKIIGSYLFFYDTKLFIDYSMAVASDKMASTDKAKNFTEYNIIFKLTTTF